MKLALKTVNADMTSRGGFRWPESGHVEAPDWNPTPECGGGLHALIWGEGDGALLNWSADARWLVLAIAADVEVIDLNGKAKFPRCDVVHCGTRLSAAQYIVEHGGFGRAVVGATLTGGDGATLTGGYHATLTGGVGATLTGGDGATLTGGVGATLTGGVGATLTGGDYATLTGGDYATLTGGYRATLTGGYRATLTGGYRATLTGGDRSQLTGGDRSQLTGGEKSVLIIRRYDGVRIRVHVAYTGENGIMPGVAYTVDDHGEWIEVQK